MTRSVAGRAVARRFTRARRARVKPAIGEPKSPISLGCTVAFVDEARLFD